MSNVKLTADVIASEALMILENNLQMGKLVYRGYEDEYSKNVNGYKKGATIRIRKPADFTVRDGAVAAIQDVVEGTTTLVVNKQKGVDFRFTSSELSLEIGELGERVLKPAMVQMANQVDADCAALYKKVWNWVGTAGNTIDSFADFAKGPERLDLGAVPQDERAAILSPSDNWGLVGAQTALYINDAASSAYRKGNLGMLGGVDTYMSQNVQTHTTGTRTNTTPLADAAANNGILSTTYSAAKDSGTMILSTDGWAVTTLKEGDVFTISTVYAVNPVSKATLAHLQQFVVVADQNVTAGDTEVTISPPIITSGAFQTVSSAPADGATIVNMGTASTNYVQNMVFHKNAFALATVPMEMPDGSVGGARKSFKGVSCRVIPYYDGTNDISSWRLDVLYGVKAIDPRLATRISGT